MIERCGDRQRKCDGLEKWPFHVFVESLPVMLQVALLLLACGLCRHMVSINASVSGVLIALTVFGVLFYLVVVVAGTSSYACPFQTPGSTALRGLWKKIRPHTTLPARRTVTTGVYIFRALSSGIRHLLWKRIVVPTGFAIRHSKQVVIWVTLNFIQWVRITLRPWRHIHHPSPEMSPEEIQESMCASPEPNSSPHGSKFSPRMDSSEPWLTPEDLSTIQKTNAKDVRCVSWILRNITDPEALDAAIRFAGTIRWFEDGMDAGPPYNTIVSVFHTCFDSTGTVYPGLLDRAYHSAQAILWIHILAMRETEEFACNFPLPHTRNKISYNSDLNSLLGIYNIIWTPDSSPYTSVFTEYNTPTHMQWASRALLHFCWTKQGNLDSFPVVSFHKILDIPWSTIPLDATLNLFLVWSIFLGCSIQEEVLKIQDKTCVISCFFPSHHS